MFLHEIFLHEETAIPLSQVSGNPVPDEIRSKAKKKKASFKIFPLDLQPQDLSDKNISRTLKTNTLNDCTYLDKIPISAVDYFSYTSNNLKYHLLISVFAILFICVLTHPLGIRSSHQD